MTSPKGIDRSMDTHSASGRVQTKGRPLSLDVSWVLSPLLALPGVARGVVLSRDGLILGGSADVTTESGERAAAMTSSVLGAARALCDGLSGGSDSGVVDIVISAEQRLLLHRPGRRPRRHRRRRHRRGQHRRAGLRSPTTGAEADQGSRRGQRGQGAGRKDMTSGRQRRRVVPDYMAAARLTVPEHISVERTTLVYVAPDAAAHGLDPPGSHLMALLGTGRCRCTNAPRTWACRTTWCGCWSPGWSVAERC